MLKCKTNYFNVARLKIALHLLQLFYIKYAVRVSFPNVTDVDINKYIGFALDSVGDRSGGRGATFIKKSTLLDQKIVTTLKPQFIPLPNKFYSSTSYIDSQLNCSTKHTLVTPDFPLFTEDFPEFVETEVEEVISANTNISEHSKPRPGAKRTKRKIVGNNLQKNRQNKFIIDFVIEKILKMRKMKIYISID
ncbi:hypothetical protein RN001_003173 [Aquatica leii]|uniref:Uncharacterized protein n=1 Tax=Aquatica leii TaxID=1421715 RepID=A0AAN7PHX6_9COLE|nr:hypothetical protein RN001_003173 [Aquatica leii]